MVSLHRQPYRSGAHPKRELRVPNLFCQPCCRDSESWPSGRLVVEPNPNPHNFNVADILKRGGSPGEIMEGSIWQHGPKFLEWPVNEWPIKSAEEVAHQAREGVNKLQRKAFVATVTRSKVKQRDSDSLCHPCHMQDGINKRGNPIAPSGWSNNLIEVQRFNTLT